MVTGSRYDTVEVDGTRLRELRRGKRKLTQRQLAAATPGVSRGYISMIELGSTSRVSRTAAEGIASALGVPLDEILPVAAAPPPSDAPLRDAEARIREVVREARLSPEQQTRLGLALAEMAGLMVRLMMRDDQPVLPAEGEVAKALDRRQ